MAHQTETWLPQGVSRKRTLSPFLVTLIRIGIETAAIFAAAALAGVLYHAFVYRTASAFPYIEFGTAFAVIFAIISFYRDDYRASASSVAGKLGQRLFSAFNLAFIAFILVAFMTKTSGSQSRGSLVVFYGLGLAALFVSRHVVTAVIHELTRVGLFAAGRVMIVGFETELQWVMDHAPQRHGYDVLSVERLVRGMDDNLDAPGSGIDDIVEKARRLHPDTIVLALPWSQAEMIDQCVRAFMNLPVRVELAPERVLERFAELRLARLGPLLTLNVLRPPMGHAGRAAKRVLDFFGALIGLILLSPLFLLVALLIKLDSPGPALFRQNRYGFNQQPFRIWKFRTMRTQDDGPVVQQAARDDARITRLGRWLRKLNIDELPQLLNVLAGQMSLVGPRPHAIAHNRFYEGKIDLYARRHNVLPGITGWAQVNGLRGATDDAAMEKRVEYDLYYLDNWSLSFDLAILFLTIFSSRSYRNAY
jgi:Undecaprenyl-phosphate glucose phosphotransferase